MADNNTVILRVQLDEGKTEDKLKQLVLDLEATTKAQAALRVERKAGTLSDEEFAKQSVALKTQLTGQRAEQTALTKNLELYRTATGALGDTYKGTQAQLSLAQRQYQELQGSQNNSTESTKALGATIAGLRAELLKTDETQGLFVRNIGNYPKGESIEPLIKQLVLLQEVQKQLPVGSQAAAEAGKRIGFEYGKLNEAAASAGLSQQQLTAKLNDLGERARPASAELAKLTIAQDAAAQSAGKDSAEYTKLGFQIGAARKEIEKVPPELAKVPTAADKASQSVLKAFQSTGLYGQSIEKAQKFVAQFKTGLDVLKSGFKGVQAGEEAATEGSKVLKVGLAEIGIGLLILAFTTLVSYFTQSAEGAKILAGVTSALGATFQVLTDLVSGTGRALALVFQGDFKGAGEQIAKQFDGVGNRILTAAKNGYQLVAMEKELAKARRELEVEDVKEQSRVAVLLRLSKERGKTATEQLGALKEAGEIEASITQKNIDLQQKELDLINLKIKQKGAGSKGDLIQQKADAEKAIAQTLASQDEQNAKIKVRQSVFLEQLRQQGLADNKAYYDARAAQAVAGTQAELEARVKVLLAERATQLGALGLTENQRQAIVASSEKAIRDLRTQYAQQALTQIAALQQLALDRELLRVKAGTEEELAIQREKLTVQRNLELAVVGLTLRQAQAIRQKYQADDLKLQQDYAKQLLVTQLQNANEVLKVQILGQQAGSDELLRLQTEQLEVQRTQAIAALDKRADNEAKIAAINAQAAKQRQKLEFDDSTRLLTEYLDKKRQAVELDHAKGVTKEVDYQRQLRDIERAGIDAQLLLNVQYGQDNAATLKKGTDFAIAQTQRETDEVKHQAEVKQEIKDASMQAAVTDTDLVIDLFGKESAAGTAALVVKKTLALAEIAINLQKQLAANALAGAKISAEAPPVTVPLGIAYTVATDALAIATSAAAAASVLKMQRGGIAYGPSHDEGGIPLYHQGRPAGIEIEGGEPVLTRRVSQNPLLLSLASTVNQLAGGRALLPNFPVPRMALGGVAQPLIQQQLRGDVGAPIDYNQLARACAQLQVKATISDVDAGLARKAFTDRQSNS